MPEEAHCLNVLGIGVQTRKLMPEEAHCLNVLGIGIQTQKTDA
jgi:hypothetical protein